jgi:GNAT superfamily N-acetyltransferase
MPILGEHSPAIFIRSGLDGGWCGAADWREFLQTYGGRKLGNAPAPCSHWYLYRNHRPVQIHRPHGHQGSSTICISQLSIPPDSDNNLAGAHMHTNTAPSNNQPLTARQLSPADIGLAPLTVELLNRTQGQGLYDLSYLERRLGNPECYVVAAFTTLSVLESRQGQGIGQLLSRRRLEWLAKREFEVVLGVSWVSGLAHIPAQRLYESIGYERIGHFALILS